MKSFRKRLPLTFWVETVSGALSCALSLLTILAPNWIERLFGSMPDAGDGTTEWGVALWLAAIALVMFLFAGRTWRRNMRLPQSA